MLVFLKMEPIEENVKTVPEKVIQNEPSFI